MLEYDEKTNIYGTPNIECLRVGMYEPRFSNSKKCNYFFFK